MARRSGTILQKRLAKAIILNTKAKHPLNKGQLLVKAGYDETTAKATPERVIAQKGVQQELEELGFTPQKAKSVVAKIMTNDEYDPNVRLKAADMTLKVYGEYAPDKHVNVNVDIEPSTAVLALAKALNITND